MFSVRNLQNQPDSKIGRLFPRSPSTVPSVDLKCSKCIQSGVKQLPGIRDPDVGQPRPVPLVIDLKQAIATVVGNPDYSRLELAFSAGYRDGSIFKVVGPDVANDLNNFSRCVLDGLSRLRGNADLIFRFDQRCDFGTIELEK